MEISYLNLPINKKAAWNLFPDKTSEKLISFSLSSNDHNMVVNNPISMACVVIAKLWLRIR